MWCSMRGECVWYFVARSAVKSTLNALGAEPPRLMVATAEGDSPMWCSMREGVRVVFCRAKCGKIHIKRTGGGAP